MKKQLSCKHNFKYSHKEYPPTGTYASIPEDKDVIICTKCGLIRRTIYRYE